MSQCHSWLSSPASRLLKDNSQDLSARRATAMRQYMDMSNLICFMYDQTIFCNSFPSHQKRFNFLSVLWCVVFFASCDRPFFLFQHWSLVYPGLGILKKRESDSQNNLTWQKLTQAGSLIYYIHIVLQSHSYEYLVPHWMNPRKRHDRRNGLLSHSWSTEIYFVCFIIADKI